jgi:TctA family transporter
MKDKTAYCVHMSARLILIEVLVFIGSFAVAWLLRKLLGRLIRGWKVGLWGLLFGLLGAVLTILALETLSFDFQFVDLGDGLNFVLVAIRLFGLTALAAGFLGAVVASFGPRKKKALPPEPPQMP